VGILRVLKLDAKVYCHARQRARLRWNYPETEFSGITFNQSVVSTEKDERKRKLVLASCSLDHSTRVYYIFI